MPLSEEKRQIVAITLKYEASEWLSMNVSQCSGPSSHW